MRVAGEHFIGAFTGQHDLHAGLAHFAAEDVLGHAVGVEEWRFVVPQGLLEIVRQVVLGDFDGVEACIVVLGSQAREAVLVVVVHVGERQVEGIQRLAMQLGGDPEHGRGVDAAAQVNAHGHIGTQAQAHRFLDGFAHCLDHPGFVGRCHCVAAGKLHVPVAAAVQAAVVDHDPAARLHTAYTLEQGVIAQVEGAAGVGVFIPLGADTGRHQGLDLRSEVPVALMLGVEQRLDPQAVTHCQHQAALTVEQHHRELAAQAVEPGQARAAVQVQGDLAVRGGLEGGTVSFELGADAFVVVELTIDHDHQVTFVGNDRLHAVVQADDAQTGMAEHGVLAGVTPEAVFVRTAVIDGDQGIKHCLVGNIVAIGLIHTDKTTHGKFLFE
ncbi:hypothetical protein D3C85_1026450 [compost metagenome]